MDPAPVRAAPGLPGGALDDPIMDDRERSDAIVDGGVDRFLQVRDPICCVTRLCDKLYKVV